MKNGGEWGEWWRREDKKKINKVRIDERFMISGIGNPNPVWKIFNPNW